MPEQDPAKIEALWREMLTVGHKHRLAVLPSSPRCGACHIPFGGVGGAVSRVIGFKPSRKNPKFCNVCEDFLPLGGAEVDISVIFADIRGSTALGEKMGPAAFAALLNRYYKTAADVILDHDGSIDKMVGDEVMALLYPSMSTAKHRSAAVTIGVELLKAVGYGQKGEPWVPIGIGIQSGPAFVGKIGSGTVTDFTALGDTVNTAARLRDEAKAGEIIMGEGVYQEVAHLYPNAERRSIPVEGKAERLDVRILRLPAA